jgi:CheY-like chemotaxis protein
MQQGGENHTKQPVKRSIMVVDDDPAFCTFLDDALTDAGYTVHPYTDSAAALAALRADRAFHPDVVLLDLVMPGHTGRDIVTVLQAEPDLRAIPVVLISALPVPNLAARLGAAATLRKPFALDDLLHVIAEL